MRGRSYGLLALLLTLAACNNPKLPTNPGARPSAPAKASVAPGDTAAPAALLRKPTGDTLTLTGVVTLDAGYATSSGAAVISNDGGTLVNTNGSNIVGQGGGNLIGQDGNGIVAQGGGNVIATDSAGVISNDGGTIVGQGGGNLIGQDGNGIVAQGGGNATSGGGTHFALLADAAPRAGQELPVAGQLVYVVTLDTQQAVQLGVDANNQPVYGVYTDAKGAFKLFLPAALKDSPIRVMARPLGNPDPGLAVSALAAVGDTAPQKLDREAAMLAALERRSLLESIVGALDHHANLVDSGATIGQAPTVLTGLGDLAQQGGYSALSPAQRALVGQQMADLILAMARKEGLTDLEVQAVPGSTFTATRVEAVMGEAFQRVLDRAAALENDPARASFLAGRPYVEAANQVRAAACSGPAFAVKSPADVGTFIVDAFLTSSDSSRRAQVVYPLADLGFERADLDELTAAMTALIISIAGSLVAHQPAVELQLKAILASAGKAQATASPPPCVAPTPAPKLPAVVVDTVAGNGTGGIASGRGALATFDDPTALAWIGDNVIGVVDTRSSQVRSVDLKDYPAKGGVVNTLFSNYFDATKDKLPHPRGLAYDGKGAYYVSDEGLHEILKITHPNETRKDPTTQADVSLETCEVVAGDGTMGADDGPHGHLNTPAGLAFDTHGDLLIADFGNHRVRKLSLSAAVPELSTVAGGPGKLGDRLYGPALEVPLGSPNYLAFDGDGSLLISDYEANRVWRLTLDNHLDVVAGGSNGNRDGFWAEAKFRTPTGLAIAPDGSAVVADRGNGNIRRLLAHAHGAADALTLAGLFQLVPGNPPFADGPGATATFGQPEGVLVGKDGTIYVADKSNQRIRGIRPAP